MSVGGAALHPGALTDVAGLADHHKAFILRQQGLETATEQGVVVDQQQLDG